MSLMPGVLEHLLESLDLLGPSVDLGLAVAGELARALGSRWAARSSGAPCRGRRRRPTTRRRRGRSFAPARSSRAGRCTATARRRAPRARSTRASSRRRSPPSPRCRPRRRGATPRALPSPRAVVANDCLVTSTERSGSTTRAQATTVSRCTSSPPTLSRICFTAGPPLMFRRLPVGDRMKRMLGFVLVATIVGPPGSPRQTSAHS